MGEDRWNRRQSASRRRSDLRAKAIALLGGCCQICKYNRAPEVLDFHHIDPMSKDFEISAATSWKRALPELQKCVLLCSNCHREVHAGLHFGYLDNGYDQRNPYSGNEDDPYGLD